MRIKKFQEKSGAVLNRAKKIARRMSGAALAGLILVGGTGVVKAANLADIFDAKQYADTYADLKEAFGDDEAALLNHYLTYGIAEGRETGGLLDIVKYRQAYPDLDAAFGDNWDAYVDHYLTYGVYEKRDNFTDFDALDYMERYGDLKEAFGDDVLALYQHYQTYGKEENREARSETVVVAEKKAAEEAREAAKKAAEEAAKKEEAEKEAAAVAEYNTVVRTETVYNDDGSYNVNEYNRDDKELRYTHYDSNGNREDYGITVYNSTGIPIDRKSYFPDDSVWAWEFDSAGNVIRDVWTHADGSYTWYEYDSTGKTVKSGYVLADGMYQLSDYDSNGYQIKSTIYNADGSIYSWRKIVSDSTGVISYETYDADDIMIASGGYVYDSAGKRVGYTDYYYENGIVQSWVEYEVNSEGFVDYESGVWHYASGESEGTHTETYYNPDDSYTVLEYDANGMLLSDYHYTADGTLESYSVHESNIADNTSKSTRYDGKGNVTGIDEFEYSSDFDDLKIVKATYRNADGSIRGWEEYEYDSAGNSVKNIYYRGDGSIGSWGESEYDSTGNVVKFTYYNGDGSIWYVSEPNADGTPAKMTYYNEDGSFTVQEFEGSDGNVRLAKETNYDANNIKINDGVFVYDSTGKLLGCMSYVYEDGILQGWNEYEADSDGNIDWDNPVAWHDISEEAAG